MSPALAAHLRLLAQLPVRTVQAKAELHQFSTAPGKLKRPNTWHRHRRIEALRARGFKQVEIAKKLNLSRATISKHWRGLIKAGRL